MVASTKFHVLTLARRRAGKEMILHVFYAEEQIYAKTFAKFASTKLTDFDHLFAFLTRTGKKGEMSSMKLFSRCSMIFELAKHADRVIFHSFIMPSIFFKMFWLHPKIQKKSSWIMWGGDVYAQKKTSMIKRFDDKINNYIKSHVIKNLRSVGGIKGDYMHVELDYPSVKVPSFFPIFYPQPITQEMMSKDLDSNIDNLNVMVGNSASVSNNHVDAFNRISSVHQDLNKIKLIVPLSHGTNVENVVQEGERIFGNAFIPLLDVVSPGSFANFLSMTDIAVMNHSRQEGMGTIIPLLAAGKKVYMRKDISSWDYFSSMGVKVFDINEMKTLEKLDDETSKSNQELMKKYFSDENCIKSWNELLNMKTVQTFQQRSSFFVFVKVWLVIRFMKKKDRLSEMIARYPGIVKDIENSHHSRNTKSSALKRLFKLHALACRRIDDLREKEIKNTK